MRCGRDGWIKPVSYTHLINGEPVHLRDSADAITHGVGMVHQELMLIPYMSVAENVTLGQEVTKGRFRLDQKKDVYKRQLCGCAAVNRRLDGLL